jgi:hypothetical protein
LATLALCGPFVTAILAHRERIDFAAPRGHDCAAPINLPGAIDSACPECVNRASRKKSKFRSIDKASSWKRILIMSSERHD